MVEKSPKPSSNYYAKQMRAADLAEKPALLVQYCHAAIAERERGEIEIYQVGNRVVT